ncbi:MAG: IS1634 family transposase [Hydrococcus sp. CRU_1_1]|nr:IS1634 family transposase [Hydrococcus sp. CRU_1_1]NJQ97088.1 IS1634 family transposase [Hydrococcus sp. CSU_1_8]
MGNFEASNIRVQDLDHCGIVAGICDEMGLVEQIDKLLGTHPQEIISPGRVVKAMILNGLGFVSAPLYLFEKFFVGKATEHLLGEGIRPEHLNDDRLGRILDKLAESGLTETFVTVALTAARQFGVKIDSLHLDSSSFHVDGEYLQTQNETVEPGAIHITHGYSRDRRPDLKQFIVDLMCSGDGDILLYLRVGDGNEADSAMFGKLVTEFKQQWDIDALFVADAAIYTADNLTQMSSLRWVSRVPATLTAAKQLLQDLDSSAFIASSLPGYKIAACGNSYAGIQQRWLVIESQARRESDLKQLDKRVATKLTSAISALKQLSTQQFACQPDALHAATTLSEQLPYHQLEGLQVVEIIEYPKRGRPRKDEVGQKHYQISATLIPQPNAMDVEIQRAGRFILATNVLDEQVLSYEDVLTEYKAQQSTERGFRFLKEPLFFTSSIFLNTPQRVAAMAMVMGLCLLVYSPCQRSLRQALDKAKQTVDNQVGKSTALPTLRWMFQCFMSIHLLTVEGAKHITNLTTERLWILQFFGAPCRKYYLLS